MRAARLGVLAVVALSLTFTGATVVMAESTISCPSGKIDILDWLTLDANLRGTKHMHGSPGGAGPIYTHLWPDKYFWIKNAAGDTMDINLYDSSFVYLWYTELTWNSPYDYRKHTYDFNMPMSPRCATPGYPGSTITITNSSYSVYQNCSLTGVHDVLRVVFDLWGPYTAGQPGQEAWRTPIGGDIPNSTEVYVLSYRYGCNSQFSNCGDKEEYVLTKKWGLVRWEHFRLINGQYVSQQKPTFNQVKSGVVSPFAPCLGASLAEGRAYSTGECSPASSLPSGASAPGRNIRYVGPDRVSPFAQRFAETAGDTPLSIDVSREMQLELIQEIEGSIFDQIEDPMCHNFGPGRPIEYLGPERPDPFGRRFLEEIEDLDSKEE